MRAVYKIFLYVLIIAVALFSCSCGDESSELQETTVTQVIPSTKATEAYNLCRFYHQSFPTISKVLSLHHYSHPYAHYEGSHLE